MNTTTVTVPLPNPRPNAWLRKRHAKNGQRRSRNEGAVPIATIYQARCWCGWSGSIAHLSQASAYAERADHICIPAP